MSAKIFRSLIVLLLTLPLLALPVQAQTPPDEIGQYTIDIEPQSDGSLKMAYRFSGYCAATDFPNTQFDAGVPNSSFDLLEAGPAEMVASASPYTAGGSWVRFQFAHVPKAGECFDFFFTILQRQMAYPSDTGVSFVFTPGWFSFAKISTLAINWRLPEDESLVKGFDPAPLSSADGVAVWEATNLAPDQKYTVKLLVDRAAFSDLLEPAPAQPTPPQAPSGGDNTLLLLCVVVVVIIIVVVVVLALFAAIESDGGYSGGSSIGGYSGGSSIGGYSGGYSSRGSGSSSGRSSGGRSGGGSGSFGGRGSSCACVSCACACACAGGSRVGCAERGFDISRLLKKKC